MQEDKKGPSPLLIIHLVSLLFFGAALSIDPLKIARAFFSDEAVYYTMAYSFAEDGDMEFQRRDLVRVYKEFAGGPSGIILKINERDKTIVFGKGFLYGLAASPFVKLFRTNGFLVLSVLLLWLNLFCGYRFCASIMRPPIAMLFSFFYFLANASLVYLFWMTPEYFNMSLVCYSFFFFISAEQFKSSTRLLKAPYNYFLSAFFFGLATYSKPTNALLVIPLGIWMLSKRKVLAALITFSIFIFTTVGLFGLNFYYTGDWNYQGGRRAVFYTRFPFEKPGVSEFAPFQKPPIAAMVRPPFYPKAFLNNWLYFFFGRYSGFAVYFFPMFFVLVYFLFVKKTSLSWAVYASGWTGILTYMIGLPWNYFGGSGTIGNRYLFNAFAVLLFAMQKEPSPKLLAAGFCCSLLFGAVFLCSPVLSSFRNSFHQQSSVFRLLPVEDTLLFDLPTNSNFIASRVAFDEPPNYFVYFLDDNTYYKETLAPYTGFWVKGERAAEFVLRAFQPASVLRLRLKSMQPNQTITVSVNGKSTKIPLRDDAFQEQLIQLPAPFPYDRDNKGATFLYNIKIQSRGGVITDLGGKGERYLGVFVRLELPEDPFRLSWNSNPFGL